jgi:ABC-type Fe3+ transport system permease subunit
MHAGDQGQRDWGMSPAAIAIVVVFMIVGLVAGWHGQKTVAAHSDIKVAKNRMRGGRKTRWRSAVWVAAISVVVLLAAWDALITH